MSNSAHITPPVRTWRDIQQSIAPKAMSSEGRRRLMWGTAKSVGALCVLCFACWGTYEIACTWEKNPGRIAAPMKSDPVRTVTLRTDGVLDHAWVMRTLALPKNIGLMELDLYALQARLIGSGQVRTAVLTRKFPDILTVLVEERSPVARVMAQVGGDAPTAFLVARDGVVFAGAGYDQALLNTLPYLDGVALKRASGKFEPIAGMDTVAELLGTAHANIPQLYRGWQVVSLARLATDGEIIVRSQQIAEITFGTREDFFTQVAKLDQIAEEAKVHADGARLRSVNLAVGGSQVPVAFELPAAPGANALSAAPLTRPPVDHGLSLRVEPQRPAFSIRFNPSSREL
jgi:cell division protein FtsQ